MFRKWKWNSSIFFLIYVIIEFLFTFCFFPVMFSQIHFHYQFPFFHIRQENVFVEKQNLTPCVCVCDIEIDCVWNRLVYYHYFWFTFLLNFRWIFWWKFVDPTLDGNLFQVFFFCWKKCIFNCFKFFFLFAFDRFHLFEWIFFEQFLFCQKEYAIGKQTNKQTSKQNRTKKTKQYNDRNLMTNIHQFKFEF